MLSIFVFYVWLAHTLYLHVIVRVWLDIDRAETNEKTPRNIVVIKSKRRKNAHTRNEQQQQQHEKETPTTNPFRFALSNETVKSTKNTWFVVARKKERHRKKCDKFPKAENIFCKANMVNMCGCECQLAMMGRFDDELLFSSLLFHFFLEFLFWLFVSSV